MSPVDYAQLSRETLADYEHALEIGAVCEFGTDCLDDLCHGSIHHYS